jgi:3-oxoacyl-[acyl-carrier-protein] synthase-3
MDTSDEWIRQRTGIEQRFWIPEGGGMGASDMGREAALLALKRAGWDAGDIDLIIFATLSPDIDFPGSGCLLQDKLGLETTPALDIRQQCSGFVYGVAVADAFIRSGVYQRILFVGSEVHSTGLDISTRGRDVAVIFGDGAGAVCLEGADGNSSAGVLGTVLHAQGRYADSLMMEAPASRLNPRISVELVEQGRHFPTMDGKAVFKHAVRRLPQVAREVLEKAGLGLEDVDLVIPHQANLRINQAFQQAMNLPDEKIFHNIQRYGNTTAASIPIALDEAIETGRVMSGSTLLFLGLGAGLTWGAVVYRHP